MKRIFLLFVMAVSMLSVFAIRAIHKPFAMQNPDGTTVMLYKNGDGYLAFYTTLDNRVVVRNEAGFLCYAKNENGRLAPSDMKVHDLTLRDAAEKEFAGSSALAPDEVVLSEEPEGTNGRHKAHVTSTSDGLGKYGSSAMGAVRTIGSFSIPVIMVEFSDVKFQENHTVEFFNRFLNEPGFSEATDGANTSLGSMKQYYEEQSYGLFSPTFEVVAKVAVSKGYSYYGKNSSDGRDLYINTLVSEAIAGAVAQGVDMSKYRYNVTYKIPLVAILYAGQGEATSSDENTIWPHEADLSNYACTFSGQKYGAYFVGNEMNGSVLMGMGVFVHEFGHALGLPDLYDPTYSYQNDDAFGMWSVMDGGAYNGNCFNPVGFTVYERGYCGWMEYKEITEPQGVLLTDPADGKGCAVVIRNPQKDNECFILQNYQQETWTPNTGGPGLMITRLNYNSERWNYNMVNNEQKQKLCTMITADGSKIARNARTSHLYGYGVADIESLPLLNGTELTSMPIYQICRHSDRSISLSCGERNLYRFVQNNGDVYEKVTNVADLATGDSIIFVNETERMAMGTSQSSTSRSATNIFLKDGQAAGNNDLQILRVVQTTDGTKWGFQYKVSNKNNYIGCGSNGALVTQNKADAKCMATLEFKEGNVLVTFGATGENTLSYFTDNTHFGCASSDNASGVCMYKKLPGNTGIQTVHVPSQGDDCYYNLSGQRVNENAQGIIIGKGKKFIRR